MSKRRLQSFVSSKMQELLEERRVIKESLKELYIDAWVFEEDAGARPETIREAYLEELERSDFYIGIFWKGYGEYTIDEYKHAVKHKKPRLIYEKKLSEGETRDPALQAFLKQEGSVTTGITIRRFHTPEELRNYIKIDVAGWLADLAREEEDQQRLIIEEKKYYCNRNEQQLEFQAKFVDLKVQKKKFQFYIVHGEKYQSHSNLVRRFSLENIDSSSDNVCEITLREYANEQNYRQSLKVEMFRQLNIPLGVQQPTIALLASELKRKENKGNVVVIFHLRSENWKPDVIPNLLNWFVKEFCNENELPPDAPDFYFFLKVVYEKEEKAAGSFFGKILGKKSRKKEIEEYFVKLDSYLHLKELAPVTTLDIRDWLCTYLPTSEIVQDKIIEQYFKEFPEEGMEMEKVEEKLKLIIDDYNNQNENLLKTGFTFS